MASAPVPTDHGGAEPERPAGRAGASPLPRSLGSSSAARRMVGSDRQPVGADRQKPGRLASTTRTLARQLGLGLGARETARTVQLRGLSVRFPDGVWAMSQQADDRDALGGAALDPSFAAIVARYQKKNQPKAAPPARRGLPYALRRRHVTGTGVGTGPTAVASRTRPADARVPRNDGHGPDALTPRPKSRSRHRPTSYDEPGPPAGTHPASVGDAARSVAARTGAPAATGRSATRPATLPPGIARFAFAASETTAADNTGEPIGSDTPARPRRSSATATAASATARSGAHAAARAIGRRTETRATLAASRLRPTARPLARSGGLRSATLTASSAVLTRMPRTLVEPAHAARPSGPTSGGATPRPATGAASSGRAGAVPKPVTAPAPRATVSAPPPGSSAGEWAARLAAAFGAPTPTVTATDASVGGASSTGATVVARTAATAWPSHAAASTLPAADDHWATAPPSTSVGGHTAFAGEPAVAARRPLGAPRLRADAMWRSTTAGALTRRGSRSLATAVGPSKSVSVAVPGAAVGRSPGAPGSRPLGLGPSPSPGLPPVRAAAADVQLPGTHRTARPPEPRRAATRPAAPAAPAAVTSPTRWALLVRVGSGRARDAGSTGAGALAVGRAPAPVTATSATVTTGARRAAEAAGADRAAVSLLGSFAVRSLRAARHHVLTRASSSGPAKAGTTTVDGASVRPAAFAAPFAAPSAASAAIGPAATSQSAAWPDATRRSPLTAPFAGSPLPAGPSRPRRWDRRAGLARAAGRPLDAAGIAGAPGPVGPLARPLARAGTTGVTVGVAADSTGAARSPRPVGRPGDIPDRWNEPGAARATPARPAVGAPLPQAYRSLAAALGNRRPVRVVHDAGARDALRRAGVPAATVGDTILLDRAPSLAPAMREHIAHELVHTAAGGPAPRLFGDPVHDHEEHAARRVGRLARQLAPVAIDGAAWPTSSPATAPGTPGTPGMVGTGHLAVSAPARPTALAAPRPPVSPFGPLGRGVDDAAGARAASSVTAGTDERSAATRPAPQSGPASPDRRTRLARAAEGRRPTGRVTRAAGSRGVSAAAASAAALIARRATPDAAAAVEAPGMPTAATTAATTGKGPKVSASDQQHEAPKRQSATERLDHLDEIVAMVEARVLAELERRGGRHRAWM